MEKLEEGKIFVVVVDSNFMAMAVKEFDSLDCAYIFSKSFPKSDFRIPVIWNGLFWLTANLEIECAPKGLLEMYERIL